MLFRSVGQPPGTVCYLNTPECKDASGITWKSDDPPTFDILVKETTPTDAEDPLADSKRIVYTTNSVVDCSGATAVQTLTDQTRYSCEIQCKNKNECNYFYLDIDGSCMIFTTLDVEKHCEEGYGGELVTKVYPKACKVTIMDDSDTVKDTLQRCGGGSSVIAPVHSTFCTDDEVYLDDLNATRIKYTSKRSAKTEWTRPWASRRTPRRSACGRRKPA